MRLTLSTVSGHAEAQFLTPSALQDIGLALHAADHVGAPLPMTRAVQALYAQVAAADPAADFSAVYQYIHAAGLEDEPAQS